MKVAVFGAGYWSQFQIAAWQSLGAEITGIWNRTKCKAQESAARFHIKKVYDDREELFETCDFDLCDIITDPCAHPEITELSVKYGKPVICQKPMAQDYKTCVKMQRLCDDNGIWNAVHENFRYQPQFIRAKQLLESGITGRLLRAELQLKSPDRKIIGVQPALAAQDHMALRDMGPHLFDVARFLFGEMTDVYSKAVCEYEDLKLDDSALSILTGANGAVISCNLVHDFDYKVNMIGENAQLIITRDNEIILRQNGIETYREKTICEALPYIPDQEREIHGAHVFAAIPNCLAMLTDTFERGIPAVTSMSDNLKTMRLVFAAMRSRDENRVVPVGEIQINGGE